MSSIRRVRLGVPGSHLVFFGFQRQTGTDAPPRHTPVSLTAFECFKSWNVFPHFYPPPSFSEWWSEICSAYFLRSGQSFQNAEKKDNGSVHWCLLSVCRWGDNDKCWVVPLDAVITFSMWGIVWVDHLAQRATEASWLKVTSQQTSEGYSYQCRRFWRGLTHSVTLESPMSPWAPRSAHYQAHISYCFVNIVSFVDINSRWKQLSCYTPVVLCCQLAHI